MCLAELRARLPRVPKRWLPLPRTDNRRRQDTPGPEAAPVHTAAAEAAAWCWCGELTLGRWCCRVHSPEVPPKVWDVLFRPPDGALTSIGLPGGWKQSHKAFCMQSLLSSPLRVFSPQPGFRRRYPPGSYSSRLSSLRSPMLRWRQAVRRPVVCSPYGVCEFRGLPHAQCSRIHCLRASENRGHEPLPHTRIVGGSVVRPFAGSSHTLSYLLRPSSNSHFLSSSLPSCRTAADPMTPCARPFYSAAAPPPGLRRSVRLPLHGAPNHHVPAGQRHPHQGQLPLQRDADPPKRSPHGCALPRGRPVHAHRRAGPLRHALEALCEPPPTPDVSPTRHADFMRLPFGLILTPPTHRLDRPVEIQGELLRAAAPGRAQGRGVPRSELAPPRAVEQQHVRQ